MDGVDLAPADRGVILAGRPPIGVPWQQLAAACGGRSPVSPAGRRRMAGLLRLSRRFADLGADAADRLLADVVVMALPPGHVDHLGPTWTQRQLPGGALCLGLGVRGLLDEETMPVPAGVLAALGVPVADCWPVARARSERMSGLAVQQVGRAGTHTGVLHPVGGCDVLTLLIGAPLRAALADGDGTGMRALAVPNRTRGWFDLARVDPAYVALAWRLTDEQERGLPRPLLVTRDEVVLPAERGDLSRHAVERA
ncbi:MAG: hypothetical protein WAL50_11065 [Kineosporiaceae bacterium]|jgi:hypothetical protein